MENQDKSIHETGVSTRDTMLFSGQLPETSGIPMENPSVSDDFPIDEIAGTTKLPVRDLPPEKTFVKVDDDPEEEEIPPEEYDNAKKRLLLFSCIAAAALLILAVGFAVFSFFRRTADDGKILPNVYVENICIGDMTRDEAAGVLSSLADSYATHSMYVDVDSISLVFDPELTGIRLNVDKILDDAYAYGRNGSRKEYYAAKQLAASNPLNLSVLDYLELDLAYIRATVKECTDTFSSTLSQPTVTLVGTVPSLEYDKISSTTAHQQLKITLGTPGRNIDADQIVDKILSAYQDRIFRISVSFPETTPEDVDLNQISRSYCIAPVDAYIDPITSELIYETYGYAFDMNEAKRLLSQASYGQTITLDFDYIVPAVKGETLRYSYFDDILFSQQTYQSSSENRLTNLRLACQAVNGITLNPGETLSFNQAVGEPSAERGYCYESAYTDGSTRLKLGGGISQVASTLYACALHTDLEIVERHCHLFPTDFAPLGMDADVQWGEYDLVFRNNTDNPIRIEAQLIDGYVSITFKGRDVRKTYVDMEYEILETIYPDDVYQTFSQENAGDHYDGEVLQYGSYGYHVRTYRCIYDKATKLLIRQTTEADSVYEPHDYIICRIAEPTEPPATETEPTEPPETGGSGDLDLSEPPATEPPPADLPTDPPVEDVPAEVPAEGSGE